MNSELLYKKYGQELYFFILKRVRDKHLSNDILQNVFLKVHQRIDQLKDQHKAKAWAFQICRNEIFDFFKNKTVYVKKEQVEAVQEKNVDVENFCCFDRFIEELPGSYKKVIDLTFIEGRKQQEVASQLDMSLANVKARIRRAKEILKEKFSQCCQYQENEKGQLVGTPDCATCS
ncbi:MAG: sigma-70 family RNA polymerase sigma factor [Bacteroidota bacterium]